MTPKQKRLAELRTKASAWSGRQSELNLVDELSDVQKTELREIEQGWSDLQLQIRTAATVCEQEEEEQRAAGAEAVKPEGDAEQRERAELRSKVRIGRYVGFAMSEQMADGAEAEFNAALGIAEGKRGTRFPLELLAPPVETRAATNVETTVTPRRWLDRLFAMTAMERVGITMESVAAGVASFPVTTAGASAAQRQRSTDAAADAAWTLSVTEMKPKRNATRLVFSIEDEARIPGLEAGLTRDLKKALLEGVDRAAFLGDSTASGSDADIVGLNTATIDEVEISQADKILGPGTLTAFVDLVDGISAMSLSDLMTVTTTGTWRTWEKTIINATADNMTLAAFLRTAGLSWSHRGELETGTDDGDFAAFVGLGMGIEGSGIAAVWESGELIRDPYGGAAKGEISLTLCYLWDFALPRASNFKRVKFGA